jgi:hypothetical protein
MFLSSCPNINPRRRPRGGLAGGGQAFVDDGAALRKQHHTRLRHTLRPPNARAESRAGGRRPNRQNRQPPTADCLATNDIVFANALQDGSPRTYTGATRGCRGRVSAAAGPSAQPRPQPREGRDVRRCQAGRVPDRRCDRTVQRQHEQCSRMLCALQQVQLCDDLCPHPVRQLDLQHQQHHRAVPELPSPSGQERPHSVHERNLLHVGRPGTGTLRQQH